MTSNLMYIVNIRAAWKLISNPCDADRLLFTQIIQFRKGLFCHQKSVSAHLCKRMTTTNKQSSRTMVEPAGYSKIEKRFHVKIFFNFRFLIFIQTNIQ